MLRIKSDDRAINEWGEYYEWQGKPFTGICYELYPNGQLMSEVEVVDGFEDGSVRVWYPSGQLQEDGYAKPGERYSWTKEWFENGKLKSERVSEFHVRLKERVWDEQGNLVSEYERSPQDRHFIEQMQRSETKMMEEREKTRRHASK